MKYYSLHIIEKGETIPASVVYKDSDPETVIADAEAIILENADVDYVKVIDSEQTVIFEKSQNRQLFDLGDGDDGRSSYYSDFTL